MIKKKFFGSTSSKAYKPKIQQNYKKTSWRNLQCSGSSQIPSQDNLDDSHRFLSLYKVLLNDKKTELHIYDTENKQKTVKILYSKIKDIKFLDDSTCITQLPNGELFCYGNWENGKALIINRSYKLRMLPSGFYCFGSSALYFENNIYCFGGSTEFGCFTVCKKFDLKNNRWINLTPLPENDYNCHSLIFNGNILICGVHCKNLWLYSIELDSFSIIPYDFEYTRKLLINIERLYLIEWGEEGLIYEGENEYHLTPISKLGQGLPYNYQMYCLYNKGKIYISVGEYYYYLFDLKKKVLVKIK